MAKKEEKAKEPESVEVVSEPKQVTNALLGCVIDWSREVQVNPKTKQQFDFEGNLLP